MKQQVRLIREVPYESERKYSAVFFEKDGTGHVAATGAVETILDFCSGMVRDGKPADLDREGIDATAQTLAEKGLRVLAVASGETGPTQHEIPLGKEALSGMVLHGLAGFVDP